MAKGIEGILEGDYGKLFSGSLRGGRLTAGDPVTMFTRRLDDRLTFDIGNNMVLANVNLNGLIANFVSYGETYPFDHWLPGVWCQNRFYQTEKLGYSVGVGDLTYDLKIQTMDYETRLLGNVIPVTRFFLDDRVDMRLVTFAPISEDGSVRPRALIYGLYIKNLTKKKLKGSVHPPELTDLITIAAADGIPIDKKVEYEIAPGEVFWLPLVIAAVPAPDALAAISKKTSEQWLKSTLAYFRSLTGKLDMPDDVFAGEFMERSIIECFNSTVMAESGEISGENSWGSFPTTDAIWMKDFHYTLMPLVMTDPDLARRAIRWFLKWSVRYKGRLEGGIEHSMANSLAPVAMAAQYYTTTGDKSFFHSDPEMCAKLKWLLDGAAKLRVGKTWLLDSKFISDGGSAGDYHTGSNMFAWYCLTGFARICEEVLGDAKSAASYRKSADGIMKDLPKHNIIDGPFGKQYAEGVNADGNLPTHKPFLRGVRGAKETPYMAHDGEESDTTLASFYGFTTYDDPALHNHKKFCLTEHNVIYSTDLEGVLWGDMQSYSTTFPAYVAGLAATRDAETMSGPEGYMTRIRKLTDLDGTIWWWPYADYSTNLRDVDHPVRGLGKCGWATGVFCCLFISQFLGLSYDAPTATLDFRPFSPSSDFTWKRFRLGEGVFTASLKRNDSSVTLSITNHTDHAVTVRYQAILPEGKSAKSATLNGKSVKTNDGGKFFEQKVAVVEEKLNAGETGTLVVGV